MNMFHYQRHDKYGDHGQAEHNSGKVPPTVVSFGGVPQQLDIICRKFRTWGCQ